MKLSNLKYNSCFYINHNRTAEDVCPYSKKASVCFLSHHKSVAGLGTQPQVSQRLFCFFFLRLKKEDFHLKPLTPGEVARLAVTERDYCWGGRTQFAPTMLTFSRTNPVGETCGLPQNNPTVFSLSLEATSLAKQRRL